MDDLPFPPPNRSERLTIADVLQDLEPMGDLSGSGSRTLRRRRKTSSSGSSRRPDDAPGDFYTRFYTAGWDWLVRSGTDWHVECAKPQLSGT
jgi:hypothetical protein